MGNLIFPAVVAGIYAIAYFFYPAQILSALTISFKLLMTIAGPFILVFFMMVLLNRFVKPQAIAKLMGQGSGIKGILLSMLGGIISLGPLAVWYPLLKSFRDKGAGSSRVAVFLGARSVKPILLPIMLSYFGWFFTVSITVLTLICSVFTGYFVGLIVPEEKLAE